MKQIYLALILISTALLCSCSNEDLAGDIDSEVFNPTKVEKEIDNKLLAGFMSGEYSASYTFKEVHIYELSDRTGMKWLCIDDCPLYYGFIPVTNPNELNISEGYFWVKNDYKNDYDNIGHEILYAIWRQYLGDASVDCKNLYCNLISPVTEDNWDDICYGYKVEIEKISVDEIRLAYIMESKVYGCENPCITRKIITYGRVSDEYTPGNVPAYPSVKERDRHMIDKIAEHYGEDAFIFSELLMRNVSIAELRKLYL